MTHPAPEPPIPVLLIEDNALDARCVAGFLALSGNRFTLTRAGSLAEGLPRLAEHHVVLLDMTLPDSCGVETFEKVHACAPEIPVVVLTGHDDEETALETLRRGAQDYIIKSEINARLLVRALRYAIERARLLAALRDAMSQLRTMRGLLPICSCCKRIRDDAGYWQEVEHYVCAHSHADFSHSYCPECLQEAIKELDRLPGPPPTSTGS